MATLFSARGPQQNLQGVAPSQLVEKVRGRNCPDIKGAPCSAAKRNGPIDDWTFGSSNNIGLNNDRVHYCEPAGGIDIHALPYVLAEKWNEGLFFMGRLKRISTHDKDGRPLEPGVSNLHFKRPLPAHLIQPGGHKYEGFTVPYKEFDVNTFAKSTENGSYAHDYGLDVFKNGTGPALYGSDIQQTINFNTEPIRRKADIKIGGWYWMAYQGYVFNHYYMGSVTLESPERVKAIQWLDCKAKKDALYKKRFIKAIPGYKYTINPLGNKSLLCLLMVTCNSEHDYTDLMKRDTSDFVYSDRIDEMYNENLYHHASDLYIFYDENPTYDEVEKRYTNRYYVVCRGDISEFDGPTILSDERAQLVPWFGVPVKKEVVQTAKIRSMIKFAFEKLISGSPALVKNVIQMNHLAFGELIEDDITKMNKLQLLNKMDILAKVFETSFAAGDPLDIQSRTDEQILSDLDRITNEVIENNTRLTRIEIRNKSRKYFEKNPDISLDLIDELAQKSLVSSGINLGPNGNVEIKKALKIIDEQASKSQHGGLFHWLWQRRWGEIIKPKDAPDEIINSICDWLKIPRDEADEKILGFAQHLYDTTLNQYMARQKDWHREWDKKLHAEDGILAFMGPVQLMSLAQAEAALQRLSAAYGLASLTVGSSLSSVLVAAVAKISAGTASLLSSSAAPYVGIAFGTILAACWVYTAAVKRVYLERVKREESALIKASCKIIERMAKMRDDSSKLKDPARLRINLDVMMDESKRRNEKARLEGLAPKFTPGEQENSYAFGALRAAAEENRIIYPANDMALAAAARGQIQASFIVGMLANIIEKYADERKKKKNNDAAEAASTAKPVSSTETAEVARQKAEAPELHTVLETPYRKSENGRRANTEEKCPVPEGWYMVEKRDPNSGKMVPLYKRERDRSEVGHWQSFPPPLNVKGTDALLAKAAEGGAKRTSRKILRRKTLKRHNNKKNITRRR
jgi:hypothetical protein